MKQWISLLAGVGIAATIATSAHAGVIVLTFEGVGDKASVDTFYNGGTDSAGHSGTNYGISFGAGNLALASTVDGGSGNFVGNPSGSTVVYFPAGGGSIVNVAAGFTSGFAFYYTSALAGVVSIYSGLDGTGTLLAQVPVAENYNLNCAPNAQADYCTWSTAGTTFQGVAESVDFSATTDFVGFDDMTFGSQFADGVDVPEPASLLMLGCGLIGLGITYRRRTRSA